MLERLQDSLRRSSDDSLPEMTLVYSLVARGVEIGEATIRTTHEILGEKRVTRSYQKVKGAGFSVIHEVVFDASPFEAISTHSRRELDGTVFGFDLRYDNGTITGEMIGRDGKKRSVRVQVPHPTVLPGMEDYVMWLADFEDRKELTIRGFDLLSGKPYTAKVRVVGETVLSIIAGEYSAYELTLSRPEGDATFFVRKRPPHVILKRTGPVGQPSVELKEIVDGFVGR